MIWLMLACAQSPESDTAAPLPGDPDFVRDPALDVAMTSSSGTSDSHNMGESCMACHQEHGPGRGRFTLAGTVYQADGSLADEGSVQAWVGGYPDGTLLIDVPIDLNGNFYTTEDLGLPGVAIVPVVIDGDGEPVNQMPWPTESGACNHCHTPARRVLMP
jgi:hypothetical protein